MNIGSVTTGAVVTGVWTAAARTLTIGGGNVVGSTLQAPVAPAPTVLTAVATTTLLTFTGAGVVTMIGNAVTAAFSAGACTVNLLITVDGGAAVSIPLMTGAMAWTAVAKAIANQTSGNGANIGDFLNLQFGIQFATSILIQLQVSATTLTAGAIQSTILYAHV